MKKEVAMFHSLSPKEEIKSILVLCEQGCEHRLQGGWKGEGIHCCKGGVPVELKGHARLYGCLTSREGQRPQVTAATTAHAQTDTRLQVLTFPFTVFS